MALKLIEGFDDGLVTQRGSFPMDIVAGRFGGGAGQVPFFAYTTYTLPFTLTGTFVMGFACRILALVYYSNVLTVGSLNLRITAGGAIEIYNGATLNATSSVTPFNVASVWRYLEVKYVLSTGAITVRVDGVTAVTGTVASVASVSTLNWGLGNGSSNYMMWDDLYILDASGTMNNDFLGDVRVQTLYPSADGNSSGMTPSTGVAHAALVDETTPNTTDYVSSATTGTKDTYQFQDLDANTASVYGIEVTNYSRKDATGPAGFSNVARVGGTDYSQTAQGLSTSWTANKNLIEKNPATNAQWAPADINSAEFGVETT